MKWLALLLGTVLWAVPPLQVVSVTRGGMPPYDDSERIYRLEGGGCGTLRKGETLVLQREGEHRKLGRLEILSVNFDHAKARLVEPGETFPLKGDLAVRTELFEPLPEVPVSLQATPIPAVATLQPRTITRTLPRSVGHGTVYREPIYFLKGDASLSPGAQNKLKAWVETWGVEGQWSLECPPTLSTLLQERISVLRSEMERLGIPRLEIKAVTEETSGRYDAIYVLKEPW
jgi:hypothetical protein